MVVARDGRLSSVELSAALQAGLRAAGLHVIDIGMATTPMLYFATRLMDTGAGIAVTGSHNPPNHNGFKLVLDGASLWDGIAALRDAMRRPIEGAAHAGGRADADAALLRRARDGRHPADPADEDRRRL